MTLSEDLRRISSDADFTDDCINAFVSDEHARYEFYIKAFALAPPPDDRTLLSLVLRDPDHAMGEAAAVAFIKRQAHRHASYQSFASWAAECGRLSPDSLDHFSDWLQRKLSYEADSSEVLAKLAEFGRTKRIRNTAKQHLAST